MAQQERLVLGALVFLQTAFFVYCTKYMVTLPKRLNYDTEILATVTAVGVPPEGDSISIKYRGKKDSSRTLESTTLKFDKDGYQTWGVVFPWQQMQLFEETGVLFEIGNVDKKLAFNPDSGYIFIQTDKPIYTPGQTVKFRIIAVDQDQNLAKYQLKVDIKNPSNVIVDRMRYSAEEAFKAQTFELPRETTIGMWSISANFEGLDNVYSATKTVEFEVREYVLPRFSADLQVDTDVISGNTGWVTFNISGKYVYGRNLQGSVELHLGTWDPNNGIQMLPYQYQGELEDGKTAVNVYMPKVLGQNEFVEDRRLYISINVTEEGTGENDTIIDTSVYLSHPYYVIDFSASDQYFKPGFPYSLKADVRSKSGLPHPGTMLFLVVVAKNNRGVKINGTLKKGYRKTNEDSMLIESFDVPKDTDRLEIMLGVLDWRRHVFTDYKHFPAKLNSVTNQYIHISMEEPISMYKAGRVQFLYTPAPAGSDEITRITVQVLSKGQVVYTTSIVKNLDGRSALALPSKLYYSVSPSMRIVAYYHATLGSQSEFVGDSLLVDTDDTCREELYIEGDGDRFKKPKEKYTLAVEGGRDSTVGLVAVDEAVLVLSNRQTLTRESFFQDMDSHDQGLGEGDGADLTDVLKNSGLEHLVYDTETEFKASASTYMEIMPGRQHITKAITGAAVDLGNKAQIPLDDWWKGRGQQVDRNRVAPPQTVRKYFPESWLFEEIKLGRSGYKELDLTLPDSITTWNFMAVSLTPGKGVCVSKPLRREVEKQFFADVRLPYKATRLEEVKVKIAMYNYLDRDINIHGIVSGQSGICFAANPERGSSEDQLEFNVRVPEKGIVTREVKIIPLKDGELTIRVDLESHSDFQEKERDVVEKTLYVVAEGRRVHKSITFVLDPEAKHVSYMGSSKKDKITLKSSPTISNTFDTKRKEQNTTIDLALPEEIIMGTESCHIAAFGDLMGDIITHAVVQSKSLVDQPIADAEEVLGDLGPTVHALLYINETGLSNEELDTKGRRFVTHGVVRLLKYKEGAFFKLTPKSKPATWLTAAVLRTLCHASKLTFIDQENLIDKSFSWLAEQVPRDGKGSVQERDWRLAEDSLEYRVMLSAEVLISLLECQRFDMEDHMSLMMGMWMFLESNMHQIQQPMVLAKATYALVLFDPDPENEDIINAVNRLRSMKRKNKMDQFYWADKDMGDSDSVPFWYQAGAKASSIEATAYALLVMLETNAQSEEVDATADWLVGQRNENGAFIGAMDSMAAIQALSQYSLKKREEEFLEIDLSCNVSSERVHGRQTHSFKFTQQDATSPKSVNNVPVGHKLEVLTKGQGLGQMHVNVEYNIPVDKNANCDFNVTVEVKTVRIRFQEDMQSNPMCFACGIGCEDGSSDDDDDDMEKEVRYVGGSDRGRGNGRTPVSEGRRDSRGRPILHEPPPPPPGTARRLVNSKKVTNARRYTPKPPTMKSFNRARTLGRLPPAVPKPPRVGPPSLQRPGVPSSSSFRRRSRSQRSVVSSHSSDPEHGHRERRSVRNHSHASKNSICLQVCLQYVHEGISAGRTSVEVEMLTGYLPVGPDIDRIADHPGVRNVQYLPERDVLVVQYDKVASDKKTCFALRVIDEQEVGRPTPASVFVREANSPQPSCALDYNPPLGQQSLQVFCADLSNTNRGECRCYSGICSSCIPIKNYNKTYSLGELQSMTCPAEIAYELSLNKIEDQHQWVEIDATVLDKVKNKTGSHDIDEKDTIKLITPSSCRCPHFVHTPNKELDHKIVLLSPDVEKLVDKGGNAVYRYLLDERSTFMKVTKPGSINPNYIHHSYLESAFKLCNNYQ